MNNYGLILNDIGLEGLLDNLMEEYIRPLSTLLYPDRGGGSIDHHHSFIVEYQLDHDLSLDMHTDDSDVTLNVCLTRDFKGGGLDFCGQLGAPEHRRHMLEYPHKQGVGVVHLGIQRHGANIIRDGYRANLIIWCRSSSFRMTDYYFQTSRYRSDKEKEQIPDQQCLSRTHDQDYKFWKSQQVGLPSSSSSLASSSASSFSSSTSSVPSTSTSTPMQISNDG